MSRFHTSWETVPLLSEKDYCRWEHVRQSGLVITEDCACLQRMYLNALLRCQFGAQGLVFASAQLITAPLVHATMQADVARDIGKSIAALGLEPPRKLLPLRIASTHGDRKVLRPVPAQNPEPKQEPVVHEKPEMCIKYHY